MTLKDRKKLKGKIDTHKISYAEISKNAKRRKMKGMGKGSLIDLYRNLDKPGKLTDRKKLNLNI